MKKITITLNDEAEAYFNEVAYSLDGGTAKVASQSEVINHCLCELAAFEKTMEQDVTGFLSDKMNETQLQG